MRLSTNVNDGRKDERHFSNDDSSSMDEGEVESTKTDDDNNNDDDNDDDEEGSTAQSEGNDSWSCESSLDSKKSLLDVETSGPLLSFQTMLFIVIGSAILTAFVVYLQFHMNQGNTSLLPFLPSGIQSFSKGNPSSHLQRKDQQQEQQQCAAPPQQQQQQKNKSNNKNRKGKPIDTATIVHVDLSRQHTETESIVQALLSAELNLVKVQPIDENNASIMHHDENIFSHIVGDFCKVSFDLHKASPSEFHMFRHIVRDSPTCHKKRYRINIRQLARIARMHDNNPQNKDKENASPKVLEMGALVFHQSRCGSTLVANALMAMNPQQHRVYSEAAPEQVVRFCHQLKHDDDVDSITTSAENTMTTAQCHQSLIPLVQDVFYLLSRTNDIRERRVFFKIHSDLSSFIPIFQQAFPSVPWAFVYRSPIQILASHFKEGKSIAKCVQQYTQTTKHFVAQLLESKKQMNLNDLKTPEQVCAATLATFVDAAMNAHTNADSSKGIFINYSELPEGLYKTIFPRFGLDINQEQKERILNIAKVYSKGGGGRQIRVFEQDAQWKEERATNAIKEAAAMFLNDMYHEIESWKQ